MSFSRYTIEKKQISLDRGVTWVDVTPSETRYGTLEGVSRTLIECEDMDCDLEEDRYTLVDDALPEEICGNQILTLPFGIASSITWTNGVASCSAWHTATPVGIGFLGEETKYSLGIRLCPDGSTRVWYSYPSNVLIHGSQITNDFITGITSDNCSYLNGEPSCFRINSFMPWCEGKIKYKMIQKQHYKKEHCSEEWVADGDPEIIGIGERWLPEFKGDHIEWHHQLATEFDEYGNVVTWESDGDIEWEDLNVEIPEGYSYSEDTEVNYTEFESISVPAITNTSNSLSVEIKGIALECFDTFFTSTTPQETRVGQWSTYVSFNKNCSSSYIADYCDENCGGVAGSHPFYTNLTKCITTEEFRYINLTYIYDLTPRREYTVTNPTIYPVNNFTIRNMVINNFSVSNNRFYTGTERINAYMIPLVNDNDGTKMYITLEMESI